MEEGQVILIPFLRRLAAYSFIFIVILTCTTYLSGCAKEEPVEISKKAERAAGGISEEAVEEIKTGHEVDDLLWRVTIKPDSPKRYDTLVARMIEAKGKPLYKWYVNGELKKESNEPVFNSDLLEKGDSVSVTVVTSERVVESEAVIVNSPPVISRALFLPSSPVTGDRLSVDLTSEDADDDIINIQYKWMINDSEIEEDSDTIQEASLKSGDRVSVVITPSDEESTGSAIERSVTIDNSPPVVGNGFREIKVENGLLTGRIEATDPDGDVLSFRIQSAPEGLKIDQDGLIEWKLPEKTEEKYPVSVSVSDEYGGESRLNFDLSFTISHP